MAALMAVLEADLRSLSAESRRRHPAVKDAAEHAILKLRSVSSPKDIAQNEDILRIFLMACEVKTVKLSAIGLSCLQKLVSHDAVAPSALKEILATLKDHGEMPDDSIQLKTLQTILIIFQSHLQPDNEENMAQALGICLHLLESARSSDSVRNTAAATFRQAVALVFDHVVSAESLPAGKGGSGGYISRVNSVTSDVNRNINRLEALDLEIVSRDSSSMRGTLTSSGKLGLRLLEDLTALAAGGSGMWLRVGTIPRAFALDILEFVLSNYVALFRNLVPYEQVLRRQICSLLMTSLRTNSEPEGEAGEPYFRRLVLRSVAHIIRLYSSTLITESEVFLSMLVRIISLDLPLWHRILVLEILRGFCVEVRTLRILFQNFDMNPKNTNIVEDMVKSLARVVSSIQFQETSEESLVAVAGMFNSKAKGVEWSLDNDASNAAVLIASEAHSVTLAIEGLLGVVFTVATLTDEAVDVGEIESPRCDSDPWGKCMGKTAALCIAMVDSMWLIILDALSLILSKSQGEAIVLEILKGYQAFTQACGVLRAVEPLNSFLASLCKFTISMPSEVEKKSVVQSPGKRSELIIDHRESIVLTPKNVQALRTLFNIAHRLHNFLGPSWVLVLETLASLDRAIHSPHASTQEVSNVVPRLTRDSSGSGQYSDFHILSSLNSQLFESSALMHVSAVKSLISALRQLSHQYMMTISGNVTQSSNQRLGTIGFAVEKLLTILVNNLHRIEPLWDEVVGHFLELADSSSQHLRNLALDVLDRSICAVLGSNLFQEPSVGEIHGVSNNMHIKSRDFRSLECAVISPLDVLYSSSQCLDVRAGCLRILLHVLERHGEKLCFSWPNILETLRSVALALEKDLVALGFQSLRVIMNDGLSTIPANYLHVCIDVTGAYSAQMTELNISLTAIGLLWTSTDFIMKGVSYQGNSELSSQLTDSNITSSEESTQTVHRDTLLFSIFSLLQKLGADERSEVRNAAVRTLFQILGSHGQKLSKSMWENCLHDYVFPTLTRASHMAATSSKDEWQGKELGTKGGKAVHMLIHHSRNTAQKQWDETLVLVLGGIARILRSFFPFLREMKEFQSGWELLLRFVEKSILNGNKEVALAAINCLQTTVVSHSPKGNFPTSYLISVLDVYGIVLQKSTDCGDNASSKIKQEILTCLGELYVHAQVMFDCVMYKQLLSVLDAVIREANFSSNNLEAEYVPLVQRTALEILPLLRPAGHLPSMWLLLIGKLLDYFPNSNAVTGSNGNELESADGVRDTREFPDGIALTSQMNGLAPPNNLGAVSNCSYLFAEKLVPIVVDLLLQAPALEKCSILPDFIQALGRCMKTRRDNPEGSLWRLAVEGLNQIIVDDVSKLTADTGITFPRAARIRIWKEVADVYEIFLVGHCGRALPSSVLTAAMLKADESLEMNVLDIVGETILICQNDAPLDTIKRLVTTLDRCASRTCSLPVETVELLPSYCSRFSLACLQKLFSLSNCTRGATVWNSFRSDVSKVSVIILMSRCDFILKKFLTDENDLGDRPLPHARVEEVIYVLQELARLVIHSDTASALPLRQSLKEGISEEDRGRTHLLVLFPSFCELVISREARVPELVQVLLRLIASELGLEKLCL